MKESTTSMNAELQKAKQALSRWGLEFKEYAVFGEVESQLEKLTLLDLEGNQLTGDATHANHLNSGVPFHF